MLSIVRALCIALPVAGQLHANQEVPLQAARPVERVAIIGAGAGGASAAYHLRRFADESKHSLPIEITIFDVNNYVGGRTTTVNAFNDSKFPVELGASIFVEVNHILFNGSRHFNLEPKSKTLKRTGSDYDLGIFDGQKFVFKIANDDGDGSNSRWKGWWDIAKLLWQYGLSPIKTQRLTKTIIGQFLKFYDEYFPFRSLQEAVQEAGLQNVLDSTGNIVLKNAGIGDQFAREIVQASTRVNYAQNLDTIHGLETLVCMATEGAMAIEGGNWQIFERFVNYSRADLRLNTAVTRVERSHEHTWLIHTNTSDTNPLEADTIILAAPYQFANVTFNPQLTHAPPRVDYVDLHVTLFTSPYRPSPGYFGLDAENELPDSILTTLNPNMDPRSARGEEAVGPTKIWSLSTLRTIPWRWNGDTEDSGPLLASEEEKEAFDNWARADSSLSDTELHDDTVILSQELYARFLSDTNRERPRPWTPPQYLYKIFSPSPLDARLLSDIFGFKQRGSNVHGRPYEDETNPKPHVFTSPESARSSATFVPISEISEEYVTWSHTKIWKSYPYLPPLQDDDNASGKHNAYPPIILDDKIYYTSSIEPFISTMETSALSGMNVARLIIDQAETEAATQQQWRKDDMHTDAPDLEKPKESTSQRSSSEFIAVPDGEL